MDDGKLVGVDDMLVVEVFSHKAIYTLVVVFHEEVDTLALAFHDAVGYNLVVISYEVAQTLVVDFHVVIFREEVDTLLMEVVVGTLATRFLVVVFHEVGDA